MARRPSLKTSCSPPSAGWRPTPSLAVLAAAACIGGLIGSTLGSRRATPRALNLALAAVLFIAGGKLVLS